MTTSGHLWLTAAQGGPPFRPLHASCPPASCCLPSPADTLPAPAAGRHLPALQPALPPGLDPGLAHDLLSVWGFLVSFPTFVCLPPITLELLLEALVQGQASALLGAIHIQLLRLLQLDTEEAYASGVLTAGGNVNFSDRAVLTSAQRLVESWAWGLDVDVWRAHVNLLTWPEVLRQVALACGAGERCLFWGGGTG